MSDDIVMRTDDDEFHPGGDDGPFDNDSDAGNEVQNIHEGDWLTSIRGKVGEPALTLEAIHRGSFPSGSKSPAFYHHEAHHPGEGAKFLTAMPFEVEEHMITDKEAEFHLKMARFVTGLSMKEQEDLAYVLLHVYNARAPGEKNIFSATRPPVKTSDFKKFYGSDSRSIASHLPIPVVVKSDDQNHSYVTLTDVIQNMLAAGTAVDQFQFETGAVPNGLDSACFDAEEPSSISQTRAAYSLLLDLKKNENDSGFVLYLWVKHWCDDFDPNNTKRSRNQVWLVTNTICPPPDENKGRNTFFMAIGQKGDDHQEINKLFEEELEHLSTVGKTFYHGGRKELIHVKAGTVCVCVDRPERASLYQVGDHNGTFSAYWGHAVDVDGTCKDNCLPCCPVCRGDQLYNHLTTGLAAPLSDSRLSCPDDECAFWNILDPRFTSKVPTDYPTVAFDQREGAPEPPLGRDHFDEDARLGCIRLTVAWLRKAAIFAHHQMKTRPPGGSSRKKYWTKARGTTFLRTCGLTTKLQDEIYDSAMRNDTLPPLPFTWQNLKAIQLNHFAAMHMLFLGHAKSNYDMNNNFLSHYKLSTAYGKQANKYLRDIQALRCNRFFDAQPLSTSTWGTGIWVSENYLFWVRALNFFCTLPALQACKHAGKDKFERDKRMSLRFCSSSLVAISRIMKENKSVGDMDAVIKIYLDTMVEMDRWLQETDVDGESEVPGSRTEAPVRESEVPGSRTEAPVSESEVRESDTEAPAVSESTGAQAGKKRKKKAKDSYNFCKSNSLGILAVAAMHRFFGPTALHWEGGWAGERKIQTAKPYFHIKNSTSDWTRLILQKLWSQHILSNLIANLNPKERALKEQTREMEGHVRIYANRDAVMDAIAECRPMSGVLGNDRSVWVGYRPNTEQFNNDTTKSTEQGWSRSAVQLLKLAFDDDATEAQLVSGLCWFAPFSVVPNVTKTLGSPLELKACVDQYVLLLPKLGAGAEYENTFYCIGSKWTERVKDGTFAQPQLARDLFEDWQWEER